MQRCGSILSYNVGLCVRRVSAGSRRLKNVKLPLRCFARPRALPPCRTLTSDVIPPPTFEGEEKKYPAKIEKLVEDITKLTLVEVADLNELLKKTLNLPDVPAMGYSSTPVAAVKEEEADDVPVKQEKSTFNVRLIKFDDAKKVAVIKEIKNLVEGMNLVQAKKFVESCPQTVRADVPKDEAEKLHASLTAAGATVEIE